MLHSYLLENVGQDITKVHKSNRKESEYNVSGSREYSDQDGSDKEESDSYFSNLDDEGDESEDNSENYGSSEENSDDEQEEDGSSEYQHSTVSV